MYYKARTHSPIFHELHGLFSKTAGIIPALRYEITRFGHRVMWTAVYGSLARGEEGAESDIDLLVVGDISTKHLLPVLGRIERKFGREVNVKRYSERE